MSEEQKELNERIKELVYQLRNNPDEAVRFEAIQELQSLQEQAERALNDLIETLHNETDYDVLYLVIETIGNFGAKAEKAVPDLIDLIDSFYDDEEILQLILDTFSKIGKAAKKAERTIKTLITDYEERTIRYYAIQTLERVTGSDAVPFLERIAANEEEDELVRIEAIKTIAKIGTKEIISKLKKLHKKVSSDEIKVNIEAVLGELGDSKIIPKLMARLMEGSQSYERAVSAEALGKIRAKEAIPILLETAMEDEDILVREKAVQALGNIRSKEATDILIQILQDELNKDLRMEVIDAFGKIGGEDIIHALESVIENDSDDDIRIKAINALVEINAANSGTILTAILYEDSSFNVRKAAGKALGLIGGANDIPPLVDMLQNLEEDEAILEIVKETLLKLGQKGYASALVGLIKNTDDIDIKDEATRMIVDIEPLKAIPELLPLLRDKDSLLRSLTAFMLSEIGKKIGFDDYEELIQAYESGAVERNLAQKQVMYELELKKQDILEKLQTAEAEIALQKERELNLRKIIKRYSEISLERMASLLKFKDTLELEKWLLELPDELAFQVQKDVVRIPQILQDETIEAEEAISRILDSFKEVGSYTCHNCGYPIEKDFKLCPDCGEPIPHCEICKLPISFGETYGFCPLCEAKGHLPHFQEWVKANGTCPHCLQKIPLEGIVPVEHAIKKR
ncbi:MAG: HEAT repeat domain-containing protein [Candidatus Heimdallarchaeota archaeon]|nr:HEAT repeat domain-containing protein [Candidatus Heimdallarchaeota archaeon]